MLSSHLKTFLGVMFVIFFVIALHYANLMRPLEKSLRKLFFVPSAFLYRATTDQSSQKDFDCRVSEQEKTVALALITEENTSLRKQLAFFAKMPFVHIGADVIGRDVEPLSNTLILNRGS